jgi:hypothetical protein
LAETDRSPQQISPEIARLAEDKARTKNWKRWGPYLSERQWATVREDYSADGACWDYFPHEHARSRAYRWGEDGLLGVTDRECRLCFSLALWNGKDPILKERLFGLTGTEGNHGEDVKECYYYLSSTPTHSYMKALYKYPQAEFPYAELIEENRDRGLDQPEYELPDTGVFAENRYWDVSVEYAKNTPDDILIKIEIVNRGPERATLHVLPTLLLRNTWSWGCSHDAPTEKPLLRLQENGLISVDHETLTRFYFAYEQLNHAAPNVLFTENDTNMYRLFGVENTSPYVKDSFHDYVVHGMEGGVNPDQLGTKAAPHYVVTLDGGESAVLRLRLFLEADRPATIFGDTFEQVFSQRFAESEDFYHTIVSGTADHQHRMIGKQAYAGLLWSKQFYQYIVRDWLDGDPDQPLPPIERYHGRNKDWVHLYNKDVISVPDKWEYPWYAAWDLSFHMIPFAKLDPEFAKQQLTMFTREWYMHPNGQIPAYEFAFGDVNPPVHAWAAWRVYKIAAKRGHRDRVFLESVFQKMLLNFTWWVNRKDLEGNNIFSGGFLGLDNIGVFDRSKELPTGGYLQQADGTAWMAFYCLTMLSVSLELAQENPVYEDMASKFFEHFVRIADAINDIGGRGLWDDDDGFYYDQLKLDEESMPLRVRSLVGLIPTIAVEVLSDDQIEALPGFHKRMKWFLDHRKDLHQTISYCGRNDLHRHRILSIPSRERLERLLSYMLSENEFLSPHGLRSLSKVHASNPYIFVADGVEHRVDYTPAESTTHLFGGNSNWRGPVWFPLNYLIIEALERYAYFYGDNFKVEHPTGSGNYLNLQEVANDLSHRLCTLFLPDHSGARPCHGRDTKYATDPNWKDLILFHEYFDGNTGRGLGANHQTGWTALVTRFLERDPEQWSTGILPPVKV